MDMKSIAKHLFSELRWNSSCKIRDSLKNKECEYFLFFIVFETNSYSVENKDGRCGVQRWQAYNQLDKRLNYDFSYWRYNWYTKNRS